MQSASDVVAVRYAMREARRAEHFIGGDPYDGLHGDEFCLSCQDRRPRQSG